MKINFTQVLQDSWNFFRNQQRILLQFVSILFMVQVASALLSPPLIPQDAVVTNGLPDLSKVNAVGFLSGYLITQFFTTFVATWGLMTIHKISLQNYRTLGESFSSTLRRFIGVLVLEIISVIPILLGIGEVGAAVATNTSPSIISLFAIIFGIWFFIRLNLSSLHYLTTQDGVGQSLQKIWLQGKNQKAALVVYTLIVYVFVPVLILQLSALATNMLFVLILGIIASLLSIFMLVVTYRFYSLFMKES